MTDLTQEEPVPEPVGAQLTGAGASGGGGTGAGAIGAGAIGAGLVGPEPVPAEPAGAGPRPRGQTRQRLLETALRLFAERGYAGTSVRDLAEELGITKAAVHYHFAAKEQIVVALLRPMLQQFADLVEDAATGPADPRALLLGVRDVLVASGPLLSVLASDPSVAKASAGLHAELDVLAARTAEVLAGPAAPPERRLRAHCALGAFFAGWDAAARAAAARTPAVRTTAPSTTAPGTAAPGTAPPHTAHARTIAACGLPGDPARAVAVADADLEVLLRAALAALGE